MAEARVVAVIQARMTSTRLPRKVLLPLAGRPVLWHVIHRLKKCHKVDEIVIATTTNGDDDVLVDFAREQEVGCVRGSEENVLSRFLLAAETYKADVIVRICSDSPLIDPLVIDQLIEQLLEERVDYCISDVRTPTVHEGFCPVSVSALRWMEQQAPEDPAAREHVTGYIHQHPERFRIATSTVDPRHVFSGARLSIDTPADLAFMEEVCHRLKADPGELDVGDLVALLKREPELLSLNSHVYQKRVDDKSYRILVRCNSGSQYGYGHLTRCLHLATELREGFGCGIVFALNEDSSGMTLVREKGFPCEICPPQADENEWLEQQVAAFRADALVLDIRKGVGSQTVAKLRTSGLFIVDIDDPTALRLVADQVYYPPAPQFEKLDWQGFTGTCQRGWPWVILGRSFQEPVAKRNGSIRTLLVCLGGSDPGGWTLPVLRALDTCEAPFSIHCVVGPGSSQGDALAAFANNSDKTIRLETELTDLAPVMRSADLAIVAFGTIAYELAAMKVPALFLCQSQDHADSAALFADQGIALNLGLFGQINEADVASAVDRVIADRTFAQIEERFPEALDGKGAWRIASNIVKGLDNVK